MSGKTTGTAAQELSDSWEKNKSVKNPRLFVFQRASIDQLAAGARWPEKHRMEELKECTCAIC